MIKYKALDCRLVEREQFAYVTATGACVESKPART